MAIATDSVLLGQIRLVAENLDRGHAVLASPTVAARLPTGVRDGLSDRIRHQEIELRGLMQRVSNGATPDELWRRLDDIQQESDEPLREALAFAEGALMRDTRVDRGLCDIADALLRELSSATRVGWSGFTILAPAESFRPRSGIVHLRFPEFTVWALPLAAHEFGHVVAQELRQLGAGNTYAFPITSELARAGDQRMHYGELFADVFATFALGPAFACTAILLRFSPREARRVDKDESHPNDGKRAFAILHTLRCLSIQENAVLQPWHGIAAALEEVWETMVEQASDPFEPVCEPDLQELKFWVEQVFLPYLERFAHDARYTTWGTAVAASRTLTGAEPTIAGGVGVSDLINAAWNVRLSLLDQPDAIDKVSEKALEACTAVIGGTV